MSSSVHTEALSIVGLNKKYGAHQVLKNLELHILDGSIHGLVGLNGSGKTTTIECLLGLQGFESGAVSVLGFNPGQLYQASGRVVAIFDTPSLHPNLTVRQNLELARRLCVTPARSTQQVEKLLGIEKYSRFKIRQLSLGNKRRASIAQALLGQPQLVILDEPFNGLDAAGVEDVLRLITDLNQQAGTTFLLCSHQLPYLEQICSHIAILHRGEIVVSETVVNLLSNSKNIALIKTSQAEQAIALIASLNGACYAGTDDSGYLQVELKKFSSADLNKFLVGNQIEVQELHLQKASLGRLFRAITNEASP